VSSSLERASPALHTAGAHRLEISMIARFGLALVALFLSAGAASADVVRLRDGRTLEGIVSEEGATVVVRQRLGEVRVDRAQVQSIESTDDPADQLERLRKELAGGTADERYRYAVFARENGFEDEARHAFLSVLRVDAEHAGARAALGYVQHEGRWLTVDDRNRALGLVQVRGEWITPAEKAAREREAQAAADKRREEREAAVAREHDRREAERVAERDARRERIAAYELALAKARAQERAAAEAEASGPTYYTGPYYPGSRNGVLGSSYGYGYGGIGLIGGRSIRTPYGYAGPVILGGDGCQTYPPGGYRGPAGGYRGPGRTGLSGSYSDGPVQLRWRLGF
jgi:hypothetical protein